MVNDTSKRHQRTKFWLRRVTFIVLIGLLGVYLVVALYFTEPFISTASRYRPLNDTIQLIQDLSKNHLSPSESQVLASDLTQFWAFTQILAVGIVWVDLAFKIDELYERFTKRRKENTEIQIIADTDDT